MSEAQVAEIVGRIPSGCSILTVAHNDQTSGMLASWIQQAAFEPLLLTVAVHRDRPLRPLIEESRAFVLNILGKEEIKAWFRHFGSGFAPGEAAFEGLQTRAVAHGVILEGALAWLACAVRDSFVAGDHWIYLAEPLDGSLLLDGEPYAHFRKSGRTY